MRKAILILAALLTGSCDEPAQNLTMIVSHPIVSADKSTLNGKFAVYLAGDPEDKGIRSLGRGGACYIADLRPLNIPSQILADRCTADSQCHNALSQPDKDAGYSGYCVHGGCWTRPGPQPELCNVRKDESRVIAQPYDLPTVQMSRFRSLALRAPRNVRSIEWMLIGCLNGVDAQDKQPEPPPCGTRDSPLAYHIPGLSVWIDLPH